MNQQVTISWGALWKVLGLAAFIAVVYVSREVFIALLLAIIIAAALDPIVSWLERRRIPRLIGTLGVYIIALFFIALILYIVIPVFLTEVNGILENGGSVFGNLIESLGIQSTILQTIVGAINQFTDSLLGGETTLVSFLSQILGGLLLAVIVFVISFYLTLGRDGVERFLQQILPHTYHNSVITVYERIRHKISHWFIGQLFLSSVMGIAVYIALSLLDVKYAFVLAILAAGLELVPFVGPIFAGSAAVLTALGQSTSLGVYTLVLFVVLQQLESNFLQPAVNRYTTNLNAVVVIVALLIGGEVLGVVGIVIAVPLAVLFQEIIKHLGHAKQPEAEPANQLIG